MEEEKIICSRCGAEMKKNQRCCIKCGNINYSHPDNASMLKYANNGVNNSYVVGAGSVVSPTVSTSIDSKFNYTISSNAGSKMICVFTNVFLFIISVIGAFLLLYNTGDAIVDVLTSVNFMIAVLALSIWGLTFIGLQFLFMKANKPWWSALVPFYSLYAYFDITMEKGWMFLLSFIPGVNLVVYLIAGFNLGKKFGYSGLFSLLLLPIAIIVMGFNTATCYDGVYYIPEENNSTEENLGKDYKINKFVLAFYGIIAIVCISMIVYYCYSTGMKLT